MYIYVTYGGHLQTTHQLWSASSFMGGMMAWRGRHGTLRGPQWEYRKTWGSLGRSITKWSGFLFRFLSFLKYWNTENLELGIFGWRFDTDNPIKYVNIRQYWYCNYCYHVLIVDNTDWYYLFINIAKIVSITIPSPIPNTTEWSQTMIIASSKPWFLGV